MSVLKVYREIIDDVVSEVRKLFLEDGVEETVLQDLRQSWEAKLMASKAVDDRTEIEKQGVLKKVNAQQTINTQQVVSPTASKIPAKAAETMKMVPIQITLPAKPGTNIPQRLLTIQVPAKALQDNQLHKVLTGPVISTVMNLEPAIASSILQKHVNATFCPTTQNSVAASNVIQIDGTADDKMEIDVPSCSQTGTNSIKLRRKKSLAQHDGIDDSTDEDDEDEEASSDDEENLTDEDEELEMDDGREQEPLNSDDDVTDEDSIELFDTENIIVCQFDQITRSRNKWKFNFKDGVMNLNGEDMLFQKARGDAEW